MNIDKLFNAFNDEEYQNEIKKVRDTPQYWIGMFKKLIQNYNNGYEFFMNNLLDSLETSPDLDKNKVRESVEYLTYTMAYNYILKLDITDLTHLYYLTLESDDTMLQSINYCLKYFESKELYERCATLHGYEKEVKRILLKFGPSKK